MSSNPKPYDYIANSLLWIFLVIINSIICYIFAYNDYGEPIQQFAIFCGIATFIIIYIKADYRYYKKGQHDNRMALRWGVTLKALTQFWPAIELISGMFAVGMVQGFTRETGFWPTYFTTVITGGFLSIAVLLLTLIAHSVVRWYRKPRKGKMIFVDDDFPWKAFTGLCWQKKKDDLQDYVLRKTLHMEHPPKAYIGEFGEPEPTNVLIAKHTDKQAYIKVVNTKKAIAEKDDNQTYIDYADPLLDFLDTCGDEFWTIIIKSEKTDFEFTYDHENALVHLAVVSGIER